MIDSPNPRMTPASKTTEAYGTGIPRNEVRAGKGAHGNHPRATPFTHLPTRVHPRAFVRIVNTPIRTRRKPTFPIACFLLWRTSFTKPKMNPVPRWRVAKRIDK